MTTEFLGIQAITDEDRTSQGSRFAEVRDAIFANPYQKVWGADGAPPLPNYQVTLQSFLRGILSFGRSYLFAQAAARTVDSHSDLRWGPDRKGFRRLIHPNGVCLTGQWEITEYNEYTGYFKKGSQALVIGRYSTCCSETRRGHTRSLSLVGKLFPTTEPNHAERLRTASFFTQEDIGGAYSNYINEAELRNAPDVTVWRRGKGLPIILIEGLVFTLVDKKSSIRQLHEIAELDKPEEEPTRSPEFMRLLVAPEQPKIEGDDLEMRDEVMAHIFDKGDPTPKRNLTFHIEVTDEGTIRGAPTNTKLISTNWRHIGKLTFSNAVISYNGDHVIHFHHPAWREDRNDPKTAFRKKTSRGRYGAQLA
ncbi:MAG: hypothetical protein ACHBNF_00020 [Chromatiales bacterium]